MGQAAHSSGEVMFKYHLPMDTFCQKYFLDPAARVLTLELALLYKAIISAMRRSGTF